MNSLCLVCFVVLFCPPFIVHSLFLSSLRETLLFNFYLCSQCGKYCNKAPGMGTWCHIYIIRTFCITDYNDWFGNKYITQVSPGRISLGLLAGAKGRMQCLSCQWLSLSLQWRFLSEKWRSFREKHGKEPESRRQRNRETEALVPAVSKQDDIFELQIMNLKIQFLSWFKQALNVGFIICIIRTLTNTSIKSALRSQQQKAGSGPSWISGSAKYASFSIFGFRVHGSIHTSSANEQASLTHSLMSEISL